MLFLLLSGCPRPCIGVGCGQEYSAALVGVITSLDELNQVPDSPREATLTILGTNDEGPDWSVVLVPGGLMAGSPGIGALYSFSNALTGDVTTESASGTLFGSNEDGFGASVAVVSRPQSQDLFVGAPLRSLEQITRQEGAVMRFSGLGAGFTGERQAQDADLLVYGEEPAGRFGDVLVSCADLDGDGTADWAASGTWDSSNQPLSGLVALALSGSLPPLGTVRAREVGGFWLGAHPGARAGAALRCDDDLTGDGIPDLLIGAPFADEGEREASGAIYLIEGPMMPSGPLLSSEYRTLVGLTSESWLGWSIDTGDLNGDGIPEIVAGAPGSVDAAGEVLIWDGAAFRDGNNLPLIRIQGAAAGDGLGRAVLLSDLDNDGDADLLVGAPHHNPLDEPDAFHSGALYGFRGAPGYQGWLPIRPADDAEWSLTVAQQYLQTGQLIAVGDFSGDNAPDVGLLLSTAPK